MNFIDMRRESVQPNDFTFPCVFKASASLRLPSMGKQVHGIAMKCGHILDVFVGCSAFDMYCKTGLKKDANKMFDEMPERNLATWNAYISNAVLAGQPQVAVAKFVDFRRSDREPDSITFCAFLNACADGFYLELGRQLHGYIIRSGNETDVLVANGLIDFYSKCKEVNSSKLVFGTMGDRNDVSWCTMVATYVQNNEEEYACDMYLKARKEGLRPNDFLVSSILRACASLAGLELGRSVHAVAVKACVEGSIYVGSALVDMYGKCGSIEDAEQSFHAMYEKNLVTWNAMIGGYAHQGHVDMAVQLFEDLSYGTCGMRPNYVTLVCVLSACSRAGAVEIGLRIFESMKERYGIEAGVEHYACVVDLLGRAGMLGRAYDFIKKMPMCPTISVWGALLNACRVYRNPELGAIAASKLFELDCKDSGNHVLLANTLAAAGR